MAFRLVRRRHVPAISTLLTLLLTLALWQAPSAHAAAQLSATQTSGLTDGQTIKVIGTGFNPSIGLFVALCDTSVPNGAACDMAFFKPVETDGNGAFSVFMKVYSTFGATSCASRPCGIQTSWIQNPKDRSQEATIPVSFGAAAPPPAQPATSSAPPPPATSAAPPTPTAEVPASVTPSAAPPSALPSTPINAPTTNLPTSIVAVADSAKTSDGSALPWIIAVVAVIVVVGAGGYWIIRKRGAGSA